MYILSAVKGEVCSIKKATCECTAAMFHLFLIITILYLIAENLQPVHMFLVCSMLWCHSHLHSFGQHLQTLMIWNHHLPLHYTPASGKSLGIEKRAT